MTPLEWIATILAVWVFVKFFLMAVNPNRFIKSASKVLTTKNIKAVKYVYLVLFFVLSYYVLQELTIVQFFVAMLAGILLIVHTFTHYPKMLKIYANQFKGENPNYKVAFDWLIWLLLAGWVLKEIFF